MPKRKYISYIIQTSTNIYVRGICWIPL